MSAIKMFHRIYGEGEPLIILHGLYGSSDNWVTVARNLEKDFKVYLPDLRNHGQSSHTEEHNYSLMCDDLLAFMNREHIYNANIIGHSMGGKVAMAFTAYNPERVKRLIIADISPRTYNYSEYENEEITGHIKILNTLSSIDLNEIKERNDVERILLKELQSKHLASFLLKNLQRTNSKTFSWKININVLRESLPMVMMGLENEEMQLNFYNGPVLFIKGGNSRYIQENDEIIIKSYFKKASIITIEGASHWIHADKPDQFISTIRDFLL